MKLTLNLKPETQAKAVKRAAELGITVEEFVRKIILKDLDKEQNLEKIFEPIRKNTERKDTSKKHN